MYNQLDIDRDAHDDTPTIEVTDPDHFDHRERKRQKQMEDPLSVIHRPGDIQALQTSYQRVQQFIQAYAISKIPGIEQSLRRIEARSQSGDPQVIRQLVGSYFNDLTALPSNPAHYLLSRNYKSQHKDFGALIEAVVTHYLVKLRLIEVITKRIDESSLVELWLGVLSEQGAKLSQEGGVGLIRLLNAYQPLSVAKANEPYCRFVLHFLAANLPFVPKYFAHLVRFFDLEEPTQLHGVHSLLQQIMTMIPSATALLLSQLRDQFPSIRDSAEIHHFFVMNTLHVLNYNRALERQIMDLLVEKVLDLDVLIDLEELPDEDDYEDLVFTVELERTKKMEQLAEKLDNIMVLLFSYIDSTTEPDQMWKILLKCFEMRVLNTHKSKYAQFLLFYMSRLKSGYAMSFLSLLFQIFTEPKRAQRVRMCALFYVGSYLCRAEFLGQQLVVEYLVNLCRFSHQYLDDWGHKLQLDVAVHGLYYALIQTILYITCFHHEKIFAGSNGRNLFQELRLLRLIEHPLTPFRFCHAAVVREFSRIAEEFSLPCDEITNRARRAHIPQFTYTNETNTLESFFPFDPCLLHKSSQKINPLYRQWVREDDEEDEEDKTDGASSGPPSMKNSLDLRNMSLGTPSSFGDLESSYQKDHTIECV